MAKLEKTYVKKRKILDAGSFAFLKKGKLAGLSNRIDR